MELKIAKTYFRELDLKRIRRDNDEKNIHINLNLKVVFSQKFLKTFRVIFTLELNDPTESFNLYCVYVAKFRTNEEITQEFKDSPFPKINAPAIAYPFLRAAISTISLNAGYIPIILPTVNFVKFSQDHKI